MSEHWVDAQTYCPNCGRPDVDRRQNNNPAADFFCFTCKEEYELKSQSKTFGSKIVDGAYRTMIEKLRGNDNPNLLLLQYDPIRLIVINLVVIPKHFFTPDLIEERKPLSPLARRAGWVGCNISLIGIPRAGRISLVKNGYIEPKNEVLAKWRATLFLRDQKNDRAKGWLLNVMKCIDAMNKKTFQIKDIYQFEADLKALYPSNQHIKEKIRQQLQVLRDKGFLDFLGRGTYRQASAKLE